MEYIPSKIENEFMDKITKELKKYENLSDLEKAYYVYYRFCQFYVRNDAFYYGYDSKAINEQYTKQTEEDRKATCYQENACIAICLNRIGINAGFLKTEIQHHVDGYFCLKSGQIYFYDAASDLVRAKTGRILRKFGIDLKTLRSTRSREYIEYIRNKFAEDGITPLEMAAAYATVANDGVYIEPTFYTAITNAKGRNIIEAKQNTKRVFSKEVAYVVKELLKQQIK